MKHTSQHGLEIIIAANQDIPLDTVKHIKRVWEKLQLLSAPSFEIECRKKTGVFEMHDSQERDSKSVVVTSIWRECLKFSWRVFQKRVDSKIDDFRVFYENNRLDFPDGSLLEQLYKTLNNIESQYTRVVEPDKEDRMMSSTSREWCAFRKSLEELNIKVDEFLRNRISHLYHAREDQNQKPNFNVASWLWEVASLYKDISVLLRVGLGNKKRRNIDDGNLYLANKCTVTPLPKGMNVPPTLPDSQEKWFNVVEAAFKRWEGRKNKGADADLCMVRDHVSADCDRMVKFAALQHPLMVHCASSIVCHSIREKKAGLPRPYHYIGTCTSSRSQGCYEFINAVNEVYGTKWRMKHVYHRKESPFWRFPDIFHGVRVAEVMYDAAFASFVWSYAGFVVDRTARQQDYSDSDNSDSEPIWCGKRVAWRQDYGDGDSSDSEPIWSGALPLAPTSF